MIPLKDAVRPTTFVRSRLLDEEVGCEVIVATETFQHTGSFKFRAAYNAASNSPAERFIAASSGNFGQALAYACKLLGRQCTIVMPANSAAVKVAAVRNYGGNVDLIDTNVVSRAARVQQLSSEDPSAVVLGAYDDDAVIEGNASLGDEIASLRDQIDCIVVPVGGGGLSSGVVTGLRRNGVDKPVYGAEPLAANDAARSLRDGRIVMNEGEPQTIADGARTVSLGKRNWAILQTGLTAIVEVPELLIVRGLRLLFSSAHLKVEPTGALSIGAVLAQPDLFAGKRVCCIVSGGNVDPKVYADLILSET